MGTEWRFETSGPVVVPPQELTALRLERSAGPAADAPSRSDAGGISFARTGWYEILLTVEWDPAERGGTRFSHTKVPGEQPLHSEAISADVLARISDGKQLLRGNAVFGPGAAGEVLLEVWHDSAEPVAVQRGALTVRDLQERVGGR